MKNMKYNQTPVEIKLREKSKRPPFKWAGGKDRMFQRYHLAGFFPEAEIETFVDCFAGSSCVSGWVRKNYPNAQIIVNDKCLELVDMFRYMQAPTWGYFKRELEVHFVKYANLTVDDRKKYYYEQRNKYALEPGLLTPVQQAATLYYLLITGFNGIWQTSQNFNYRYATSAGLQTMNPNGSGFDMNRIKQFSDFISTVTLMHVDFEDTEAYAGPNTWFYADPPYRCSYSRYNSAGEFTDSDQKRLTEFLNSCDEKGSFCTLSNREPFDHDYANNHATSAQGDVIEGWFSDKFDETWNVHYFPTKYTAGRHNHGKGANGTEVLIRNYEK